MDDQNIMVVMVTDDHIDETQDQKLQSFSYKIDMDPNGI